MKSTFLYPSSAAQRIAAFLFVYFPDRSHCLHQPDGPGRIAGNALVALTLLSAASRPGNKDVRATLVVNLLDDDN